MGEHELARIWRDQLLDRSALRTTRGEPVEVVYRGRPERSPGPDFREAILVLGGELRHGDVELHVRASDWSVHGHDRDRHFDRVILHVVARDDGRGPTLTTRGVEVPVLALGGEPAETPGEAADAPAPEETCRARIAALDDAALGERLDRLGDARLRARAALLEADLALADPEQVLYERLLEALGYSQNRRPCLELARRLPIAALYALAHRRAPGERALLCEALLLGVAGLLPSQRVLQAPLDWASAEHADELERTWATFGAGWEPEVLPPGSWNLGVRPLNSPPRRLGALSSFLAAHLETDLYRALTRSLRAPDGATAIERALAFIAVDAPDSYWAGYFDLGRPVGASAARLIGLERALVVVVDVCLPLAVAQSLATGDTATHEAAWVAYAAAPRLAPNQVTRWMLTSVLGRERAGVVNSARRQQGLHHAFRAGCDQRRCDDCPLDPAVAGRARASVLGRARAVE